jgi:hypothetical protein
MAAIELWVHPIGSVFFLSSLTLHELSQLGQVWAGFFLIICVIYSLFRPANRKIGDSR